MNMFLQFGHGMMALSKALCKTWGGGYVILSPRDMNENQMANLTVDLKSLNAVTMIDPQLYNPRGTHHGLSKHEFWPDYYNTSIFWGSSHSSLMMRKLYELNERVGASIFLLPGIHAKRADDDFFAVQEAMLEDSEEYLIPACRFATICLSHEMLKDEVQLERIANAASHWQVAGYYIVPEYRSGDYLKEDPVWLINLINFCWSLKLHQRKVIVGYANHQLLCLALAKVDALASGTWLNVRTFSTEKFDEPEEDAVSRRVKWYYCPQALSEFKLPFLDIAKTNGVLDTMRPQPTLQTYEADVLFSGASPSDTDYAEQQSFKHYLTSLRSQAIRASSFSSFEETIDYQYSVLSDAKALLNSLHQHGVRGQARDFSDYIDVNLAVLDTIKLNRGFAMRMQWNKF